VALDGLEEVRVERRFVARSAASSSSTTPSDSSPERSSCPASILRCSSSRQLAKASTQASIVQLQRPSSVTSNSPAQRSPSMWASIRRIERSRQPSPPGGQDLTTARRTSWPSAKMSALTATGSPTVRLDG
jgi:hypothetical protein